MSERWVGVMDVLRYARGADTVTVQLDGYLNYHFLTAAPGRKQSDPRVTCGVSVLAVGSGLRLTAGRVRLARAALV